MTPPASRCDSIAAEICIVWTWRKMLWAPMDCWLSPGGHVEDPKGGKKFRCLRCLLSLTSVCKKTHLYGFKSDTLCILCIYIYIIFIFIEKSRLGDDVSRVILHPSYFQVCLLGSWSWVRILLWSCWMVELWYDTSKIVVEFFFHWVREKKHQLMFYVFIQCVRNNEKLPK